MLDLSNPWYVITLLGAPELWMVFTALLFGAYLAFRTGSLGGRNVHNLLFLLAPALLLTFVSVVVLKSYFDVPRQCVPCIAELVGCNPHCPFDASLPSGHSATAFAGFAAIWLFKGAGKGGKRWLLIFTLPLLVAISRIILGVHTWLDVFAGSVLGMAIALAVREIDRKL
jgi:membrane-associated phospholipid phosphatase